MLNPLIPETSNAGDGMEQQSKEPLQGSHSSTETSGCSADSVSQAEEDSHSSLELSQEKQGVIMDLSGIPWLLLPWALARLCAEPNLRGYRKRRWNGVLVRHSTPGVVPTLCLVQADVVFTVHIVKIIFLNRPITVTGDSFLIVRRGNDV